MRVRSITIYHRKYILLTYRNRYTLTVYLFHFNVVFHNKVERMSKKMNREKTKWGYMDGIIREVPEITMLYQNDKSLMFYAYSDSSSDYLISDYINDHKSVFKEDEMRKLHIEKRKFNSLHEKHIFQNKYELYQIRRLFDSSVSVTGYEHSIYNDDIQGWYTMYKDIVVISQILPNVLTPSKCFMDLSKIGSEMYDIVDNFSRFTELLSTNYIKSSLLVHPITAMKMYSESMSIKKRFEYQMFKDC